MAECEKVGLKPEDMELPEVSTTNIKADNDNV